MKTILHFSKLVTVFVLALGSHAIDAKEPETTPLTLPGSEAHVFRKVGDVELRMHMVKPEGWAAGRARPCLVSYFGGGWVSGTPERGINWAKWAASQGMVGIAPDYRTRDRHHAEPEDCVADGRTAMAWIVAHAAELGVDPGKSSRSAARPAVTRPLGQRSRHPVQARTTPRRRYCLWRWSCSIR